MGKQSESEKRLISSRKSVSFTEAFLGEVSQLHLFAQFYQSAFGSLSLNLTGKELFKNNLKCLLQKHLDLNETKLCKPLFFKMNIEHFGRTEGGE